MCGFCGKINKKSLCKKCENSLNREAIVAIENSDEYSFDEHMYFFKYDGFIRNMILRYKFRNKAYLYKSFSKFMIKNEKLMEFLKSYDIIVPVPISKKRFKTRGYNQSLLISNELAMLYNYAVGKNVLQVNDKCLYKEKDTIEQSKLNKEQRAMNVEGVYILKNKQILTNKRILLVDDIFTTGNTVEKCSQMIKETKPKEIGILTIAKDFVD